MDIIIKEEIKQSPKKVVGTQVNGEIYSKLAKDAEEDFISISDILRKIIYTYYRNKEKEIKE